LTGRGRYVDNIRVPGMLHLAILRSPHAHAVISSVDLSRARHRLVCASPWPGPISREGSGRSSRTGFFPAGRCPTGRSWPSIGCVSSANASPWSWRRRATPPTTLYDALDLIEVAYDPLPAVVDEEAAIGEGAPQLHQNVRNNITTRYKIGG